MLTFAVIYNELKLEPDSDRIRIISHKNGLQFHPMLTRYRFEQLKGMVGSNRVFCRVLEIHNLQPVAHIAGRSTGWMNCRKP